MRYLFPFLLDRKRILKASGCQKSILHYNTTPGVGVTRTTTQPRLHLTKCLRFLLAAIMSTPVADPRQTPLSQPEMAGIILIPWDPDSPDHINRMKQQRIACGWKVDDVDSWAELQRLGKIGLHWIVSGLFHFQLSSINSRLYSCNQIAVAMSQEPVACAAFSHEVKDNAIASS